RRSQTGERKSVGVNCFQSGKETHKVEVFRPNPQTYEIQVARLLRLRLERDNELVGTTLKALRHACATGENVMPPLIAAVKAYATVGEIGQLLRDVFGIWRMPVDI
ncbi:MAG: methylmalonyl-CoA mutase family protein, partial [Dehalococcoidia bacterium]|nr:methylmalonyl-CoA mutase family protein [Dehalococcoidia bacterium]